MAGEWITVAAGAGEAGGAIDGAVGRSADGGELHAYLAVPAKGSGPGVLVCAPWEGRGSGAEAGSEASSEASLEASLEADFRAIADRLAEEGYVACVPSLSGRAHSKGERSDGTPQSTAAAHASDGGIHPSAALDQVAAAIAALRAHPRCRGRIGALGFGSGGRLALLAAAAGWVDCVATYDATGLDAEHGTLGEIKVPTVLHFAQTERASQGSDVDTIRSLLSARDEVELYVYANVAPGFERPAQLAYNSPASGMAYSRTLALLRRVLGPRFHLSGLWDIHRYCEFGSRDAAATMATMVAEPYVNHVPTLIGGFGQTDLHRFYRDHFIPNNPKDMRNIPVSQTVGADRVVNEGILCFTHDCEIEWMLPGVAPTGRYVEIALVGIITFRGEKLVHEHIYWDQASVLVQIGLLDPRGLPVAGIEAARKVLNPALPSNALMHNWQPGDDGAHSGGADLGNVKA